LLGADYVQSTTSGPGTGFTRRVITSPDGNILEDRVVTAVGTYSATAPVNGAGWVMQLVAFRGASGSSDNQPPTVPASVVASAVCADQRHRNGRVQQPDQRDVDSFHRQRGGNGLSSGTLPGCRVHDLYTSRNARGDDLRRYGPDRVDEL